MTSPEPKQIVWNEDNVRRFWSYYARFPESYFGFRHGASLVRLLRPIIPHDDVVLDYGCGPGFFLEALYAAGLKGGGTDLAAGTIGNAKARLGSNPLCSGFWTLDEILGAGRRFSVVTLLEVVEHLDDAMLESCMANIRSVIAPGGLLVITTPNEEDLSKETVYCPTSNLLFHRWQHVRSWSASELSKMLDVAGFTPVQVLTEDLALVGNRSPRAILKRLLLKGGLLAGKPPSLIVVARRRADGP